MRKLIYMLVVLAGFQSSLGAQEEKHYESAYFPLRVGNRWRYQTAGHEVVVLCDKSEKIKVKSKDEKGADVDVLATVYHLRTSSDANVLTETVGVLADGVYRFSGAGKEINPPLCLLKLPLKVGDKWSTNAMVEKTKISGEFESREEAVSVPAGKFTTRTALSNDFQVGAESMEVGFWFAEGVGIVRQRTRIGAGKEVVLELKSFEKGK